MSTTEPSLADARQRDLQDPLANWAGQFHFPSQDGRRDLYLVGNSLGLQPRSTAGRVLEELEKWQQLGVRGHFSQPRPWLSYHALLTEPMAAIVGGRPEEVVVMNTLTVNLHLMMATFYRPRANGRHQILVEQHAFPSDRNAVESQIRWHGLNPENSLIELAPDRGQRFSTEGICEALREGRDRLALVLLPGVQYYTGQVLDMQAIAATAAELEIPLGLDLAHAAGNIPLQLHAWGVDFACWCTYKYLNSGPGSLAGCFIHQRHVGKRDLPRLAGWWGSDEESRFEMSGQFSPIPTAEGWQLSNPPILSMAAIAASLEVFQQAGGMQPLREKSILQGQFFRHCLAQRLPSEVRVITPAEESGCQLSLEVLDGNVDGKQIHERLEARGIRTDWRYPNVIRAAPTPLYNSFEDIWHFVEGLAECLEASHP